LARPVQVDATPEDITNDPDVAVGFAIVGALADVVTTLGPFGLVRLLLRLRLLPPYLEKGACTRPAIDLRQGVAP